MNDMNKKLSVLLLSGILGAMALPAFADDDTDAPGTPGPTTPSTPMTPGDDGEGIPPVQGPKTDGNPGGEGSGGNGAGDGSGSGAGN